MKTSDVETMIARAATVSAMNLSQIAWITDLDPLTVKFQDGSTGNITAVSKGLVLHVDDWVNVQYTGKGYLLLGVLDLIESEEPADQWDVEAEVGDNSVDTQHIVDSAITSLKLAFDSVQTAHIVDLAVEHAKVALDAIDSENIAADAVNTEHVVDAAIEAAQIATGAVEETKIAALAVTSAKIAAAAITNAKIENLAVTAAKIADLAVTNAKVDNAAITTAKIDNLAVTTALIDNAAVTNAKIDALAVDTAQIALAAITTALIDNLAVTDAKIASMVVDKLLAGDLQVAEYIQSFGFELNPEDPIDGFRIEGSGDAYFTNVAVGSFAYQIDNEGSGSFETISINSDDPIENLRVGGVPLYGDKDNPGILWNRPWGIIAFGTRGAHASFTTTETAVIEVHADLVEGRTYRIYTSTLAFTSTGTSPTTSSPMRPTVRIRENGASVPSTSSNLLTRASPPGIVSNGARQYTCTIDLVMRCLSGSTTASIINPGEHRFLLTAGITAAGAGDTCELDTASGATNPIQLIIEDMGPAVEDIGIDHSGSGGSGGSGSGGTVEKEYTKTYDATATKAFRGDGSLHSSSEGAQGNGSNSPNGNMSAVFGFDQSTIQADLAGADIISCHVYLYYDHWHFTSGGTAVIGTHSVTNVGALSSRPTSDMTENRKRMTGWNRNEGKWVSLGPSIGAEFKSGASAGICIGRGRDSGGSLDNSDIYYGKTRAHNETNKPKVRIKYKK